MSEQIIIAAVALAGIGMIALTALRGWQGWLALKERELERITATTSSTSRRIDHDSGHDIDSGTGIGTARIEIADLKERIRKLEAIASGVDL